MSRQVQTSESSVIHPSGYIAKSVDGAWYKLSNPTNAYKEYNTDTSTYCMIRLTRGASAETKIYFTFDTSAIPEDATIDSMSCIARVLCSNGSSSNIASKGAKMCSGTTEKTAAVSCTTSASNRTFTMGTWTREEVKDVRLKMYATRGSSNVNSDYHLRLYGATLTIGYTYNKTYYEISVGSEVSGVTVVTADTEVGEGDNTTITVSGGTPSETYSLVDNDTNVTSRLVDSGSVYEYFLPNVTEDHTILAVAPLAPNPLLHFKRNGQWVEVASMFIKQNGVWKSVEEFYMKQGGRWKSSSRILSPLPIGYVEVEYIQNTGIAYLVTDISGNDSLWEITAECTSASQNEIVVCRSTGTGNWFGVSYSSGGSTWSYVTTPISARAQITATFTSSGVTGEVNGESYNRANSTASTNAYQLFGYNGTYPFLGKIIGNVVCKQSDIEVFHGIPCISPDNEVGLYDIISDSFIGSANSTKFIAGPAL